MDLTQFKSKGELFEYLIANKSQLVALKKAAIKFTDPNVFIEKEEGMLTKLATTSLSKDDLVNGVIQRTVVGNTYNWMDSHCDVHFKGCFTKSISENQNKLHLHDHIQQLTAKVGKPLSIYEKSVNWNDLGVNRVGKTIALMMDTEIKRSYNGLIYEEYLAGEITQHSVGMMYVKIALAIKDPQYKEEYATWSTYADKIGNIDVAEEHGYFWAVTEAKLVEISAVIRGSNELTPTLDNRNKFTLEDEPTTVTQKKEPKKGIDFKYLADNYN